MQTKQFKSLCDWSGKGKGNKVAVGCYEGPGVSKMFSWFLAERGLLWNGKGSRGNNTDFPEQEMAIGGWRPRLPDIVRILAKIMSSLCTFI